MPDNTPEADRWLPPAAAQAGLAALRRQVAGRRRGRLFVLSAPSGTGKDSVIERLKQDAVAINYTLHTTTRRPRPDEVDGEHYRFITPEQFRAERDQGGFLEWATYLDSYYGTPRAPVEQALARGEAVLVKPDVQGAMQIRDRYPDAVLIFLAPPDTDELVARLSGRGTESQAERQRRVERSLAEIAHIPQYDYLVINHHGRLDDTVAKVKAIIIAEQQRVRAAPHPSSGRRARE